MAKQICGIRLKPRRIIRLYSFFALIAALVFAIPEKTMVFADAAKEYTVKAAFILHFARYAKWPDGSFEGDLSPCLLYAQRDRGIKPAFRSAAGKKIGTRKLVVRFAKTPQDVGPCHMIFISRTVKPSDVLKTLEAVKGKPVLTISETDEFIRQGGMINFFTKSERLYFEINMDIVRQQNVKLSSRLLKLAVLAGKQ